MMASPKGISRQLGPEDNIGRCPHGATLAMLKTRCPSCHIVDLEAENARLQEQVKEADEVVVLAVAALHERVREVDLLKRERDDYKALAERRKGVLVKLLEEDVPMPPMIILDVHAAIDEVGI
ncbi:hypothetical protein LCGC14_1321090 [marine sediment metagenome]|uniref:Uncharacterized protein n=1 Tax=marine sediment metagenome TaxID=412755 RepID=A0A0F9KK40_9ZZZZ